MHFILTQEAAYSWHIFCRKVSGVIAVVVLVIHAVRYRDLNALNNQLLLDIKAELRHLRNILFSFLLSPYFMFNFCVSKE